MCVCVSNRNISGVSCVRNGENKSQDLWSMSRTKMTLRLGLAAITALVALCALLSATAVSAQVQ